MLCRHRTHAAPVSVRAEPPHRTMSEREHRRTSCERADESNTQLLSAKLHTEVTKLYTDDAAQAAETAKLGMAVGLLAPT